MKRPALLALALVASACSGFTVAQADPFANAWTRQPTGRIPVVDRNNVVTYTIKHGQTDTDRVSFVLVLSAGSKAGSNIYDKMLVVTSGNDTTLLSNLGGNERLHMASLPDDFRGRHGLLDGSNWPKLLIRVTPASRVNGIPVLKSDLNAGASIELRKDNFMGGFSSAAVLHDLEYLQGGDVVTITWEREQN